MASIYLIILPLNARDSILDAVDPLSTFNNYIEISIIGVCAFYQSL
ncbi:MAG: hypothetical protein QW146_07565 [Candidatus Bathyarchaeia archaeon]